MVVVLGMLRVAFLLDEGPATDVLQAPRGVPPLDQADGLQSKRRRKRGIRDAETEGELLFVTLLINCSCSTTLSRFGC